VDGELEGKKKSEVMSLLEKMEVLDELGREWALLWSDIIMVDVNRWFV
jgi:hypothetical protein